ncbi:TonB family protein [Bacteroides acidifaciens]|uniref:TonB family protein n=1 Tax=Bacteroides acidifaciens TaxID=85831 RepID=UPI003015591C
MKTKLLMLVISLLVCLPLLSQNRPTQKVDEDGVYLMPDKLPEFPGGISALMNHLGANIKYPVEAQKKGVSGRVLVQFVVMEDGTLSQVKTLKGVEPSLDEEALRVVREMPKWTPGMADGKKVKVKFTIPIVFGLEKIKSGNQSFKLVIPSGQEVKNRTLSGVWQQCMIDLKEEGYRLSLGSLMKIFSADNSFMNILFDVQKMGSVILAQGEYEVVSDTVYVEKLNKSVYSSFPAGVKNEISIEHLHDNLIKLSFKVPGNEQTGTEYWYRVPSPDIKIMTD